MKAELTAAEIAAAHEESVDNEFGYSHCSDYSPLLKSIAAVALQVDQEEYQGDTWALLRDGDRFGYLCFGWGSCSGCDALQGCESWEDVAKLRNELFTDVHWEDSAKALLDWLEKHDWEGEYFWEDEDFARFLAEAKELLKAQS